MTGLTRGVQNDWITGDRGTFGRRQASGREFRVRMTGGEIGTGQEVRGWAARTQAG